jgi:Protein of unknown function (DUF3800)
MPKIFCLYLDDSGARHPDHDAGRKPAHKHDWFALGGFLIQEEHEAIYRSEYAKFCDSWGITYPLRSADVRAKTENFRWLRTLDSAGTEKFYEELYQLMAGAPVIGIACTIDRPGYNHRYREKYGRNRWDLCKTAFSIAVERSSKYARSNDAKLRVYVERGDKKTDANMRAYYDSMRTNGMPFGGDTSGKYAPLSATELSETLYEFQTKFKSSPMAQLADLFTWPLAIGGYDKDNRTYARLVSDKKIIDCELREEDLPYLGCKYSCFELVAEKAQKNENPDLSGSSAATSG